MVSTEIFYTFLLNITVVTLTMVCPTKSRFFFRNTTLEECTMDYTPGCTICWRSIEVPIRTQVSTKISPTSSQNITATRSVTPRPAYTPNFTACWPSITAVTLTMTCTANYTPC
uniref:(northern house mosquito) hypothetical protein n=1 Tax=Culex pipiens TaxID=7175 RepID=A0A8D8K568_CULPI